jgi:uncharacterized membrane protein
MQAEPKNVSILPAARLVMRSIMTTFYALAGIAHLTLTDKFLLIVPDWVPFPRAVVLLTGICEIAGSIALLSTRTRRLAGLMLALYAACVFPANLKHAIEGIHLPPVPIPGGIADRGWRFSRCWSGGPCSAPR